MNMNVLGTYYAAQLAAAQMTKQEPQTLILGGNIVFSASIATYAERKGQFTSDYCASKGAVLSLTKALGVELAAQGIRVNSISPGQVLVSRRLSMSLILHDVTRYMLTDMTVNLMDRIPYLAHIMTTDPPMWRIGDRRDLKGLIVYLLSDASACQSSEDILATGGIHAGRLL